MSRHAFTVGLWVATLLIVGFGVVRGGPWLWPKLFPAPAAEVAQQAAATLDPSEAAERVHRFLAGWGLPADEARIDLPKGKTPRELQDGLRADPRFEGLEVYVTRSGDLRWTLRVFQAGSELVQQPVRPWLPERPNLPTVAPRLGFVVALDEPSQDAARRLGRWDVPLAMALPPFHPQTLKAARQASWEQKDVVLRVDATAPLSEQLAAVPQASGVVLLDGLPPGDWLAAVASADAFVLDGRSEPEPTLAEQVAAAGVPYLVPAATLGPSDAPRMARNRAVRAGRALVVAAGDDAGLGALEAFVASAREDGYELAFPAEVARSAPHGDP